MQKKAELNERDFFKNPFTAGEIKALLRGSRPSDMFNFRSPSFKKLSLDPGSLQDKDLIERMLQEPRLIRRPVVKIGEKVYFGASAKKLTNIIKA